MNLKPLLMVTALSLTLAIPAYAQDHSGSPVHHCPKGTMCRQGGAVLDPPPHQPVLDPPPPGNYGGPTGIWKHRPQGPVLDPPPHQRVLDQPPSGRIGPEPVFQRPSPGPVLDPPPSLQSDGLRHGPVADPGPSGGIWKGHRKLDPPSGEQ